MSRPRPVRPSGLVCWIALGALCGCIDVEGLEFDLGGGAPVGGDTGNGAGSQGGGGAGARTYFDVVMEDSPLAYFRFGEAPGTAGALDASGNGEDAVYFAGEGTFALGQAGALANDDDTALRLADGAYVVLSPNTFDFSGHREYSVEGWVQHESGDQGGACWTVENELGQGFITFLYPDAIFHKRHDAAGGTEEIQQNQTPLQTPGTYHHVVVTFDGAQGQLYVDGAQVLARPQAFDFELPLITDAIIVADTSVLSPSSILFDELAIYDHALSLQRVEAHYHCGNENSCE